MKREARKFLTAKFAKHANGREMVDRRTRASSLFTTHSSLFTLRCLSPPRARWAFFLGSFWSDITHVASGFRAGFLLFLHFRLFVGHALHP